MVSNCDKFSFGRMGDWFQLIAVTHIILVDRVREIISWIALYTPCISSRAEIHSNSLSYTIFERVKAELEEYKKKQQAVNEAILRQRELDEKQDFYRVCLSEFTIEDINLLQEIRQKITYIWKS